MLGRSLPAGSESRHPLAKSAILMEPGAPQVWSAAALRRGTNTAWDVGW